MTASSTLELRARRRVVDEQWRSGSQGSEAEPEGHAVVLVCDFGYEFVKPLRRCNVTRRDRWFFRAAQVSDATQFSADRPRVYAGLLHLFALASLDLIRAKLALPALPQPLLLCSDVPPGWESTQPDAGGEPLDPDDVWSEGGRAAVQRLRWQFIAGNAPAMLAASGYRLGPLLRAARQGDSPG